MIKIKSFGSGSSGNGYLLDDGHSQLLIECGINFKKVMQAMNFDMSNVEACLITHEHTDHCQFTDQMLKDTSIDVYATRGTNAAIRDYFYDKKNKSLDSYRFNHFVIKDSHKNNSETNIPIYQTEKIGTWFVTPFHVHHDATEPVGFLIDNIDGDRLVFVTDTYYVNYKFPNVTHLMVEMNYSREVFASLDKDNSFQSILQSRVAKSHFEFSNSLDFIKSNTGPKLQEVWLLHLSSKNSDKKMFLEATQKQTGVPVYIA